MTAINEHNGYSSSLVCTGCGNGGPPRYDVWVDAFERSPTFGLCSECRNPDRVALALPPDPALDAERVSRETTLTRIVPFAIQTTEQKAAFAAALSEVQTAWKKYDAEEKTETKPLLAQVEAHREKYRRLKVVYKKLEETIKKKLHDYEVALALASEEATTRARELAAEGRTDEAHAMLAAAGCEPENAPGMSTKHPWQWEVPDPYLLPVGYLLPNVKAINEEMRRQLKEKPDEPPAIAGVKFFRGLRVDGARRKAVK